MTREFDAQDRESDAQTPEFDTQDTGLHGAYLRTELVNAIGLPAVRSLVRGGRLVAYSRQVLVNRHRTLDLLTRAAAALLTAGPKSGSRQPHRGADPRLHRRRGRHDPLVGWL